MKWHFLFYKRIVTTLHSRLHAFGVSLGEFDFVEYVRFVVVGDGVFLAAFQEVGVVDAVFAGEFHAADAHGVFLGNGDLSFHDTEEVSLF